MDSDDVIRTQSAHGLVLDGVRWCHNSQTWSLSFPTDVQVPEFTTTSSCILNWICSGSWTFHARLKCLPDRSHKLFLLNSYVRHHFRMSHHSESSWMPQTFYVLRSFILLTPKSCNILMINKRLMLKSFFSSIFVFKLFTFQSLNTPIQ